ncbi:hypothetical protein, partial [Ilumatobacter sp.]|uniref:hypothetical protein n=1 Tax=Ilumatobacter sp. TaxID=1967498 RepID=UPI003AF600DB
MLKDQVRHTTREMPARLPETPQRVPEFPEGVTIPDDLSGLEFPTRPSRAATAVRWLRWIPLVAVIAIGAVTAFELLRDDGTTDQTVPVSNAATEQVPSGSAFDAVQVPVLNAATEQVPSGS